ncbi:MAG: hypothetical protein KKC46_12780 [Proteobacteria bacterium]|nr:hypothetical protein [Pseudomonadota bacterium]
MESEMKAVEGRENEYFGYATLFTMKHLTQNTTHRKKMDCRSYIRCAVFGARFPKHNGGYQS